MAAPKKHSSARSRRNKASTASMLSPLIEGEFRSIPKPPDGVAWELRTLDYWSRLWESEMTPEWLESDYDNVVICAELYNDFVIAETAKDRKDAAGELRLQRKMLGLDPLSRRSLEWTIEGAEAAKDRGKSRRTAQSAPQPAAGDDPRLTLVQ